MSLYSFKNALKTCVVCYCLFLFFLVFCCCFVVVGVFFVGLKKKKNYDKPTVTDGSQTYRDVAASHLYPLFYFIIICVRTFYPDFILSLSAFCQQ